MPFPSRSILVATDLSNSAGAIVEAAGALARLSDADLHVVHAVEGEEREGSEDHGSSSRALQAHLREVLPANDDAISARVGWGRPDDVILRRTEEIDADLIVIGPHRRTHSPNRELGTTADRLVRAADVPCLIVHGPLSLPLRSVLIPSDLSDAGRGAVDLGLAWCAALRQPSGGSTRTAVEILHIRRGRSAPVLGGESTGPGVAPSLEEEIRGAIERSGTGSLLQPTPREIEADNPVRGILQRAEAVRADLLVLGTHGRSARARDRIGSVSSAVAREATCPVLLVPPALWKRRQERERTIRDAAARDDQPSG